MRFNGLGKGGGGLQDPAEAADSLSMSPIGSYFSSPSHASALNVGAATIQAGAQQLAGEAQRIADPNAPDATSALLNLDQSSLLAQAGAAVVRTSDRMLGTLLDAFA